MFLASFPATAQTRIGMAGTPDSEISQPKTTLFVTVEVERREIIAGPYARYTQKHLGILAPLASRVSHEIKSVKVSETAPTPTCRKPCAVPAAKTETSHMNPEHGFPKLTVDRMSNAQQSTEESARAAAARIFEIRKNRYELVSGDAGENVFGAGLGDALRELDRLEEEYLALFLGKETHTTIIGRYAVTPVQNVLNYTLCRYTETDGLLPTDDLSGAPVVIELEPTGDPVSTEGLNIAKNPGPKTPAYRIAADVRCRVVFEGRELASTVIPLYQFGETVYLAK